jgi:hypothetical protein
MSISHAGRLPDNSELYRHGHSITDEQQQRGRQIRLAEARRLFNDGVVVALPVPSFFGEIIGYPGEVRYVALLWEAEECYLYDGSPAIRGETDTFLAFIHHWSVAPFLHGCSLGSEEYWLVLDRCRDEVVLVLAENAHRLIQSQWHKVEAEQVRVSQNGQWALLVQEAQSHMEHMSLNLLSLEIQHQQKVQELLAWLNSQYA